MSNQKDLISTVIECNKMSDLDLDYLIDEAEQFVEKYLINNKNDSKNRPLIKTHQIRRFYNVVRNLKNTLKKEKNRKLTNGEKAKLLMLRPQLANASAKQNKLKTLTNVITSMIKKVDTIEDFDKFSNFFESLVAFHNVYTNE